MFHVEPICREVIKGFDGGVAESAKKIITMVLIPSGKFVWPTNPCDGHRLVDVFLQGGVGNRANRSDLGVSTL